MTKVWLGSVVLSLALLRARSATAQDDFFGGTAQSSGLTAAECAATNTELWLVTAVASTIALISFFVLYSVAIRRRWLIRMPSIGRFLAILLPFTIAPAVVLSQTRLSTDLFLRCRESVDHASILVLPTLEPWMQGLIFGFAPVLVLAFVLQLLVGLLRK